MASKIKVDQLETVDGTGNITVNQPLSGSGAGLTSLPAANLTGSLPAISGASLTGIPAANITGVIPAANLGTGTASASTFLNGSGAYSEAGGGAWNVITSTNVTTSVSSIEFTTGIDSTYDQYCFVITNAISDTANADFAVLVRSADGPGWQGSPYRYHFGESDDSSTATQKKTSQGHTRLNLADNGYKVSMRFWLPDPSDTTYHKYMSWEGCHSDQNGYVQINTGGGTWTGTTNAINGIKFHFQSYNCVHGRFTMYGLSHT